MFKVSEPFASLAHQASRMEPIVIGRLVSLLDLRVGMFSLMSICKFSSSDKNRAPDDHAVGNFDARSPVRFKSLNLKGST